MTVECRNDARWLLFIDEECLTCWKVEVYEELARIFSEDNNQSAQRELLMKEGTAKFAETVGENDRQLQKVIQKQSSYANVISTSSYSSSFWSNLVLFLE